jgi:hypothetical protein
MRYLLLAKAMMQKDPNTTKEYANYDLQNSRSLSSVRNSTGMIVTVKRIPGGLEVPTCQSLPRTARHTYATGMKISPQI